MIHYRHFIKDFNNETRHLTRVEQSLYRDLRDVYLEQEKPLTIDFDKLSRKVMAHSTEEKEALKYVLSEFFELTGDCYSNDWCDEQIAWYRAQTSNKSKGGKASAAKRKAEAEARKAERIAEASKDLTEPNSCSTAVQHESNEPVTSNQYLITNNTISSELQSSTENEAFLFLTLNDKSEFAISENQVEEWQDLYPAVDVRQEIRNMRGWCNANPRKRKTKRGILSFVTNWLSRSQNQGGAINATNKQNSRNANQDNSAAARAKRATELWRNGGG